MLLTEEEWSERSKKKASSDGAYDGSSGSSRGSRGHGGGNRGRGRGHSGRGDGSDSSGRRENHNCHRCRKRGDWARECRSKQPKKEEQAYTAQEESSLLFVELNTIDSHNPNLSDDCRPPEGLDLTRELRLEDKCAGGDNPVHAGAVAPGGTLTRGATMATSKSQVISKPGDTTKPVHLDEQRVYAVLGNEGDKDPRQWVLDTRVSNHMMGTTEIVRFGDGSIVRMEG
jgi:hypothetical protein